MKTRNLLKPLGALASRKPQWACPTTNFLTVTVLTLLLPMLFTGSGRAQEEPPPADGPAVVTDQLDYLPGTTATIAGSGFQAGETVTLEVRHADGTPDTGADHAPWTVVASVDGTFQTTWHVCEDDCRGATLLLWATGGSGTSAQVYFTDAICGGTIYGWGIKSFLGVGTTGPHVTSPILAAPLPGGRKHAVIASGKDSSHGLVIADDGTMWSWGVNDYGQLGVGGPPPFFSLVPLQVAALPGGRIPVAIATGTRNSWVLAQDGTIWASGDGGAGQLGNGSTSGSYTLVPVNALPGGRTAVAIAGGGLQCFALAGDGTVWAWGYNFNGQLGNGTFGASANSLTPTQVNALPGGRTVVAITAGFSYGLALANDATLWSWGSDISGVLGNGLPLAQSAVPVAVNALSGGRTPVAIFGGGNHAFALASDGTAWAWGHNLNGQLGIGSVVAQNVPTQVSPLPGGRTYVALAGSIDHSLAIANDGSVWAWGRGGNGQLGTGILLPFGANSPIQVLSLPGAGRTTHAIAASAGHSFALTVTLGGSGTVVADPQSVTTCPTTAVNITLSASDSDGGPITFTITTPPAHGSLSGTAPNLTYTPSAGFTGPDSFVFTASDIGGCAFASATVTINVQDTIAPVIILLGANPMTVECHSTFTDPGATATDNCAGNLTASIGVIGSVNTSVPGPYTLAYSVSDPSGNATTALRTVNVVDTTPPLLVVDTTPITVVDNDCSGDETVSLPLASASDTCDANPSVSNDAPAVFPAGQTAIVTYTATDDSGNRATAALAVTVKYGATIQVRAAKHSVGSGAYPSSTKTPLVGITVGAYDTSAGSCARQQDQQGDGISWQEYAAIVANCTPVNTAVSDGNGVAIINLPPGDYVVISHFDSNGDSTLDQYMGVSAGDLACGQTMQKHLQLLVDAQGNKKPGKTTRLTGSELLIIEPEYVVWDATQQLYPFVFESVGDWGVTTSVTPPEGFVADFGLLAAQVNNELEAVQFTITEVGSELVPTRTTFHVSHKGRRQVVRGSVDIRLTPNYAAARGFDVRALRAKGLIVDRP